MPAYQGCPGKKPLNGCSIMPPTPRSMGQKAILQSVHLSVCLSCPVSDRVDWDSWDPVVCGLAESAWLSTATCSCSDSGLNSYHDPCRAWDCMMIHTMLLKSKLAIRNTGEWWLRLLACSREVQHASDHDEQIAAAAVANCGKTR